MSGLVLLWLPILVSAVAVFVASSLIHMVLPWHRNDFPRMPNEDSVMDALRPLGIPPGSYFFPRPATRQEMRSPEFMERMKRGPVAMLTVMPGSMSMGPTMAKWFGYILIVCALSAYVAINALNPGAPTNSVIRFVGVPAFLGFTLALWQMSIWYARPWSLTLKATLDGLLYAAITAGVFAWLWPA
jgi:hypothetical protein